jgi:hypothetical protein
MLKMIKEPMVRDLFEHRMILGTFSMMLMPSLLSLFRGPK